MKKHIIIIGGILLTFFGATQFVFCDDELIDDVYYNPRFERESEYSAQYDRKKRAKEIVFVEDTTQTYTDTIRTIIK